MKLSDCIRVNARYTRSINIERDGADADAPRPYVLTSRAQQTLGRILASLSMEQCPRSWALVGPYGAGKSAFALFLHSLLGASYASATTAKQILRRSDANLYETSTRLFRGFKPACCILLTGSPDSLSKRLVAAMTLAAGRYFVGGRPPGIVAELQKAAAADRHSVADVIKLLEKLQAAVARRRGRAVILIVDELGKFLEFEARHQGSSDIYLLQALAEHAVREASAPFLLVTLLHQTLDTYAQRFGDELRNEWRKISGRFETVPFLETVEQTIRVISTVLIHKLPVQLQERMLDEVRRHLCVLKAQAALPAGMSGDEAERILAKCYPLHPLSLLILPTLCQKVAQNERTLFSYLGSQEPHGFLEQLNRLEIGGDLPWIMPSAIYEYFILNQPGLAVDHTTHRRWAEVMTALERAGDAPGEEIDLIKTIGLLNIIGAQGGLKASDAILELCFRDRTQRVVQSGLSKSLITHRKFSGEYRIWQGTDFDLDAAVAAARSEIGQMDLGEALTLLQPLPPLVARRHAVTTGTLRYFSPVFISSPSFGKIYTRKRPTVFFCMPENLYESERFKRRLIELSGPTIGAIYPAAGALRDALLEVEALRRVQRQSQELANDPVAQRELKDRLSAAEALQRQLVQSIVENPSALEWIMRGCTVQISDRRDLQNHISSLLDQRYFEAPIIRNELIDRDKPSSNAIAARKKLLLAMLSEAHKPDLGMGKFPPEKAMYRSLLRFTKLHVQIGERWDFQAPPTGPDDTARIRPAWNAVMALLDADSGRPVSFESIYALLAAEPFGMKEGFLPVFVLAVYLALKRDIALCESGQFVPFLTQDVLEGLLKNPAIYTLQRVRLNAVQRALHRCYSMVLTGGEVTSADSLVAMLQPLAKVMLNLPEYTKRTRRLSAEAIAVRDLFFAAKTPVQLVFHDLPAACGIALSEGPELHQQAELFAKKLGSVLTEIKIAYHSLLSDFVEDLRAAFALDRKLSLHELREVLRGRSEGLQALTIDQQGLKAFIGRLCDPYGDESAWAINVATFLARKPPEKWSDDDIQMAQYRLREYVSRLNDLRQLQLHYERGRTHGPKDFDAALLRVVSTNKGESEALVMLDERLKQLVAGHAQDVFARLSKLPTSEMQLATLVSVLERLLRPRSSDDIDASARKAAK